MATKPQPTPLSPTDVERAFRIFERLVDHYADPLMSEPDGKVKARLARFSIESLAAFNKAVAL